VSLAFRLLALALALSMSPGFVELVEDGAHVLFAGHSDHADGEQSCPEHGCTPSSHRCACCASLPMTSSPSPMVIAAASDVGSIHLPCGDTAGPRGFRTRLERPPIA
jgi:hypothetical protein